MGEAGGGGSKSFKLIKSFVPDLSCVPCGSHLVLQVGATARARTAIYGRIPYAKLRMWDKVAGKVWEGGLRITRWKKFHRYSSGFAGGSDALLLNQTIDLIGQGKLYSRYKPANVIFKAIELDWWYKTNDPNKPCE